ncbi:PAS domain-containing protein [Candidatus Sumerlaeota bacterium]|nr:PAS domain-containing protein [Candidatus Sumerlaeota bacterium]
MIQNFSTEDLTDKDSVLATVLNSLFDGVYIVDPERRILFWNRGAEEITGYPANEVAGRWCGDDILNHIDEQGRLLCRGACPLLQVIQTGEPARAKVYPLHKSGRRFPVMTHIAPIRGPENEILAAIEVFRDISKEEDYRILQEKFQRVVQKYVSHTTFEEIVAQAHSEAGSAAVERDLTILYLDVVGFTPLSEKHTPEEVVDLLNTLFSTCGVITKECHGDIDKFMGDAVMAVFIDANDAVQAARTILGVSLPEFNRLRAQDGREEVRVRIGINSGRVLQGDVGTLDRKDRTVIGDVVNTAQRIERACPPGSILISETTYARLSEENAARFAFHGEEAVKGKADRVRIFAVKE